MDWNGDTWDWVSSNPTPFSGALEHQSAIAAGMHQHMFTGAVDTMNVNTGDVLYCYVYIDPANLPSEIMLQWYDGSTYNHRAYWGANNIAMGTDGTTSRQSMGALPAAGEWVQLQIPAKSVGLEGVTVSGMAFTEYDGRATWDVTGKGTLVSSSSNGNTGGGGGTTNPPTNGGGGTSNSPLAISLETPVNNTAYAAPASIWLSGYGSGGNVVTNMEFFAGSTRIGQSGTMTSVTPNSVVGSTNPPLTGFGANLNWK